MNTRPVLMFPDIQSFQAMPLLAPRDNEGSYLYEHHPTKSFSRTKLPSMRDRMPGFEWRLLDLFLLSARNHLHGIGGGFRHSRGVPSCAQDVP